MRYFKPTNGGEVKCYGGTTASAKKPAGLTGVRAEKAANNPDFTEVVKVTKKKVSKKRVSKK